MASFSDYANPQNGMSPHNRWSSISDEPSRAVPSLDGMEGRSSTGSPTEQMMLCLSPTLRAIVFSGGFCAIRFHSPCRRQVGNVPNALRIGCALCCPCLPKKWFAFSCSFYFQYFVCTNDCWIKSNKILRSTLFKWPIVSIVNDRTSVAPPSECRSFMDHGASSLKADNVHLIPRNRLESHLKGA